MQNKGFIDGYSLRHVLSTLCLGLILILIGNTHSFLHQPFYYFSIGLLFIVLWEVIEIVSRISKKRKGAYYKILTKILPPSTFYKETKINILSDIVIGIISLVIVFYISKHLSLI